MRTRNDVIKHFTYQPPWEETDKARQIVDRAVTATERDTFDALANVMLKQLQFVDIGAYRRDAHAKVDEALRACALAIFDNVPEVPDRTAALRTLWLARGLFHKAIEEHNEVMSTAAMVHLAEVRIQAIGAIVLR